MKKKKIVFLGGCAALFLLMGGSVAERKITEETADMIFVEDGEQVSGGLTVPLTYEKESKSGKVRFQCKLEIPEEVQEEPVKELFVEGENFGDREKAYANFVEGREIKEKHNIPGDDQYPQEDVYILSNGEDVSIGNGFGFGTENVKYYLYMGAMNPDNQEAYLSTPVSFLTEQEAIQRIKEVLANSGFPEEEFEFHAYPLSSSVSKQIEDQYIAEGTLQPDKRKSEWNQEDDAYAIYGYQMKNGLPIYHELLSISRQLAYDTPDAAPVWAIYSSRGLESIRVYCVYDFTETENEIVLMDFYKIAEVVETKFENILDDSNFVVERAKLYQRVSRNEKQEYVAEPVWYFEVADNSGNESVTLVNAVSGKEIFLQ